MSLRERAALRRKARQLKKALDENNISGVFDNMNFDEFITKPNAELDAAEAEIEAKPDEDSGPNDYLQMLMELDASLELVRQNIEKEVKL